LNLLIFGLFSMAMDFKFRDFEPADMGAVHALNEGAVPNMNSLTPSALGQLIAQSSYMKVAVIDGEIAGFLLGMGEGLDYQSLNYRWFSNNCKDFAYIDRIVVGEKFRGHGIAKAFYNDMAETLKSAAKWLACEVNISPPNPGSMTFHHKFGFYEVGRQDTEKGTKRVSLLIKGLHTDAAPCSLKKVA
jgi:uncharacterized protein